MKRQRLESRRVRVVLPTSRPPMPPEMNPLLIRAYSLGKQAARAFTSSTPLGPKQVKALDEKNGIGFTHDGLKHLYGAVFFAGMYIELEERLSRKSFVPQAAQENKYITGSMFQIKLIRALLELPNQSAAAVFGIHDRIPGLPKEWWSRGCAGAITVSRLAHFLLSESWRVFLPTPWEDIHWKIDLIAKGPNAAYSLCFQVKSDQRIEWVKSRVLLSHPNGNESENTRRFWDGVRRLQSRVHGVYRPVEVTFGSWQFDEGAVEARGYFSIALRDMLRETQNEIARS